jgi:hypothetical protein
MRYFHRLCLSRYNGSLTSEPNLKYQNFLDLIFRNKRRKLTHSGNLIKTLILSTEKRQKINLFVNIFRKQCFI